MSIDDAIRQAVREEVAVAMARVPRKAWTVGEVAESLGVSKSTVHHWIDEGLLVAFRRGSVLRISVEEVDRFVAAKDAA